nr:PqqD family peptide modification chaperone [uncultured Draconibacterium sp.]
MKNFSIDSVVQRKDDHLIISELGDDLVMMDIENGAYLSLNKTGRIIWEMIGKPVKVEDLIQSLTERFRIDEDVCIPETIGFLSQIAEQKALEIV